MSLLKEIREHDGGAARTLEKAELRTDSEIRSLTREDLHELFPGAEKLKLRRNILKIIHKQKPVEKLLQDLRGFLPEDSIKDALTSDGVLVDYLHLLKDVKAQLSNVQSFLDAHIGLLEEIRARPRQTIVPVATASRYAPNDATSKKSQDLVAEKQSVACSRPPSSNKYLCFQIPQVKYKLVVSGQTFGAHLQILDQLKSPPQQLNLVEGQGSEDCQVVLVFCPIVSRLGTDVDAAMKMVPGDEPVILVLMHHSHEAKHVATGATWDYKNDRDVHCVSVFYHERMRGLIKCQENDRAISGIKHELLKPGGIAEPSQHSAHTGAGHSPSGGIYNNVTSHSENKSTSFLSSFFSR